MLDGLSRRAATDARRYSTNRSAAAGSHVAGGGGAWLASIPTCRVAMPAAEGRTRSQAIERGRWEDHVLDMTIRSRHKRYLVVSASLLNRS